MSTQQTDTTQSSSSSPAAAANAAGADEQKSSRRERCSRDCDDHDGEGHRHGFRRHRRGGLFFAVLLALVAGTAGGYIGKTFAQGGPGYFGMHHASHATMASDPARMNEHVERMVKHFAVETDASPAQQEKLSGIVKSAFADLAPLRDKLRAARVDAIKLMKADTVDRAAIERLRADQLLVAETTSKRLTQAIADAADVLTPQQRQKVAGKLEKWMEWADRMRG
jgi:protein CpxP